MANPISQLGMMEGMYLSNLYNAQYRQENGVSADMLPYTENLKWIVSEMEKKFPKRRWTEKLVSRSLVRMRKAHLLEKTEHKAEIPAFKKDHDVELNVEVAGKTPAPEAPETTEDDQ